MFSIHNFNTIFSGCSKVAVVNLVIGILLQRYLKRTNLDTEEAHQRADLVDNMWDGFVVAVKDPRLIIGEGFVLSFLRMLEILLVNGIIMYLIVSLHRIGILHQQILDFMLGFKTVEPPQHLGTALFVIAICMLGLLSLGEISYILNLYQAKMHVM